jgi:hypothetical protein
MPEERKSGLRGVSPSIDISDLVRAHGITRDQARRLVNKIGNNRAKLDEAARTLKSRSLPRWASKMRVVLSSDAETMRDP